MPGNQAMVVKGWVDRCRPPGAWLMLLLALFCAQGVAADDSRCLMCHQQTLDAGLAHSAHGLGPDPRGEQAAVNCTSCHGPSSQHAGNPRQPPDRSFAAQASSNESAVDTHAESADAACMSCHSIHSATDPVQEPKGQFEVCTHCHQPIAMQQMQFSRHPLREGLVACTDCHAPHGGSALNGLVQPTLNDVCYQCHAEKRGPFLFEHEPVQDDCTHCHKPHASVNEHLLHSRQPFLCQQCHIAARHPGTVYDSQRLEQRDINIIGQSCTNCHSQVHGGNQPANSTFRR